MFFREKRGIKTGAVLRILDSIAIQHIYRPREVVIAKRCRGQHRTTDARRVNTNKGDNKLLIHN